MTDGKSTEKSLLELILDEMFREMAAREEFDAKTVRRLKQLASSSGLSDSTKVEAALKSSLGVSDEDS